jgi:Helix-hairpin-helix motif
MARRRFRIFGTGADEGHGGSGHADPAEAVPAVEPDASNPIAAMAAEAESLAAESAAAPVREPDLEPPSWVVAGPKPEARSDLDPEPGAEAAPEAKPEPAAAEPKETAAQRLSLSLAEFDELRGLGMSATQAKRVIRYRDERSGFRTLDELDQVPGFPRSFLSGLRERVVP